MQEVLFFFNDTATTEIYTLSLHDALPISEDIDISWSLGNLHLDLPCLASAIDAAVDPVTAGIIGSLGGLAVLNLEGVQTRYEDPGPVFEEIASLPEQKATRRSEEHTSELQLRQYIVCRLLLEKKKVIKHTA